MINTERWVKYYREMLFNEDRDEYRDGLEEVLRSTKSHEVVSRITKEEIKSALKCIKNGRNRGPGGVYIELVKNAPDVVVEILACMLNKVLIDEECIPKEWKLAYVTSIFKEEFPLDCSNYKAT